MRLKLRSVKYINTKLLVLLLCGTAFAQHNSNWGTALTQMTLPSSIITSNVYGIRGVGNMPDGYIYVGTDLGMVRALDSCEANHLGDTSCWTTINTGLPAGVLSTYLNVREFVYANGKVYGSFYHPGTGHNGTVCWFSGSSWTCGTSSSNMTSSGITGGLTADISGNLYTGTSSVSRSTDAGVTWTDMTGGDVATFCGTSPTGSMFTIRVWGGLLYIGGEMDFASIPLNFGSCTVVLPHPTYSGNLRAAVANSVSAAITEMTAISHDSHINYYNGSTWTDVTPSDSTQFWIKRELAAGTDAHEYYYVGGTVNAFTGMVGSVDGGATWQAVGSPIAIANNNGCAFQPFSVSPLTDSKVTGLSGSSGVCTTAAYYHPGFQVTASVSQAIGAGGAAGSGAVIH